MRQAVRAMGTITLAALLAGCGSGVEQRIAKSRSSVYDAFASSFDSSSETGTATKDGHQVPVEIKIDKTVNKAIDAVFLVDNDEAARVHLTFAPAEGGTATDVGGTISLDPAKLPDHADVPIPPNVPQFALDAALAQTLKKAAAQIEETGSLGLGTSPFAMGSGTPGGGSDDKWAQQARQRAASAPTTDLNGYEARAAMRAASKPMIDASRPMQSNRPMTPNE